MSHPSQPSSDPNNPYAQQPQQGAGLPSYGAAGDPAYGAAGYGAPTTMPGTVNGARIMLYVTGGLSVIGAILMFVAAAALGTIADDPELQGDANIEMLSDMGTGLIAFVGVLYLGFAVGGILLAVKFAKGGNGLRIGTIVYGALAIVMGIVGIPVGLIFIILAVLIIVFVAKSDGKAWFNRPRY
ncbi:hypothetical protein N566_02645 [Streptomycetaceae bacterium MP113-05]|nr:hypothetical protein N566_02645 [Streptomycetaceae bacterium MP113-05]